MERRDRFKIGLDVFDSAITLHKLLPKLVRSTALDAIDARHAAPQPPIAQEDVQTFLCSVTNAQMQSFAALGVGEDVRLSATTVSGGALIIEGRVIHLCAFQMENTRREPEDAVGQNGYNSAPTTTLSRPSQRRNLHR